MTKSRIICCSFVISLALCTENLRKMDKNLQYLSIFKSVSYRSLLLVGLHLVVWWILNLLNRMSASIRSIFILRDGTGTESDCHHSQIDPDSQMFLWLQFPAAFCSSLRLMYPAPGVQTQLPTNSNSEAPSWGIIEVYYIHIILCVCIYIYIYIYTYIYIYISIEMVCVYIYIQYTYIYSMYIYIYIVYIYSIYNEKNPSLKECAPIPTKNDALIAPGEAVESTLRMLKSGGTCSAFRSPWQQRNSDAADESLNNITIVTRLSPDYQTIRRLSVDYQDISYLVFILFIFRLSG